MKPVIRYLIVCIVMAIFVGIVVYFLLYSPPQKVSGPCGSGKCNDATNEPATVQTAPNLNIANVLNEHTISTNPVKESMAEEESDDEDIPDLVEAFVPPIEAIAGLSKFMQSMEGSVNKNQTVIEEISDASSGEEENDIISCGQIHELAKELVKHEEDTTDEQPITIEEVKPVPEVAVPPPTPKRRGRPKVTSKKEKEISKILTPDKVLNSITE